MNPLKDLFLSQLADMYDAEHRTGKALAKLVKAAPCAKLKTALASHLSETEDQAKKLEAVFHCFDEKPKAQRCEATIGLLKESDEIVADFKGSPSINAAIIAAARKVEHYEIVTYGCLGQWAELLGNERAANLIQGIRSQEQAADEKLDELARNCCNSEALGEGDDSGVEAMAEETSHGRRRKAA